MIARIATTEHGKAIDVADGLVHHWVGAVFVPGGSTPVRYRGVDPPVVGGIALLHTFGRHGLVGRHLERPPAGRLEDRLEHEHLTDRRHREFSEIALRKAIIDRLYSDSLLSKIALSIAADRIAAEIDQLHSEPARRH